MTSTVSVNHMTVAEYLTLQVEASGKTQMEIARDAGFNKPNIITMLKKGSTRVPVDKIIPLARVLNIDPMFFFIKVMGEYYPETTGAFTKLSSQGVLTANEILVIKALRGAGLPTEALPDSDIGKITRAIQTAIA